MVEWYAWNKKDRIENFHTYNLKIRQETQNYKSHDTYR